MGDRFAEVHFRVVRFNRWLLLLGAAAALAIWILPLRAVLPVAAPAPRVHPGVTLLNRDLGGADAGALRQLLADLARDSVRAPEPARRLTRATGEAYVVPERNGYAIDLDATELRVLTAPPGARVLPVWTEVPAAITVNDFPDLPIYSANPGQRSVALIINVDWGEEFLPRMLGTLRQHGARATFLVTGRWAQKNPELVQQMAREGHDVGNHGYNLGGPSPLGLVKSGKLRADIESADQVLRTLLGTQPRFYQPHKGEANAAVVQTARELGYLTIMWSLDTRDWQPGTTPAVVEQRVLGRVKPGDLVLMHPTDPSAAALAPVLQGLASRNLQAVTLTAILSPRAHLPADPPPRQEQPPVGQPTRR